MVWMRQNLIILQLAPRILTLNNRISCAQLRQHYILNTDQSSECVPGTHTQGKLQRIYIVKRGFIREPVWRLFLSRLPHFLQATSPWGKRKSATATHVEQ